MFDPDDAPGTGPVSGRATLGPLTRGTRSASASDTIDTEAPEEAADRGKTTAGDSGSARSRAGRSALSGKSRRSSRTGRTSGSAKATGTGKRRGGFDLLVGLTHRWSNRTIGLAMVLIVAGIAVALTLAAPLRNSMSNRSEFAQLSASNSDLRKQIAYYEQKINEQNDPAYIEAQARERLHFVYPGEKAVVMMYPGDDARKAAERQAAQHANNPWYSNLWDAVATPPKK